MSESHNEQIVSVFGQAEPILRQADELFASCGELSQAEKTYVATQLEVYAERLRKGDMTSLVLKNILSKEG